MDGFGQSWGPQRFGNDDFQSPENRSRQRWSSQLLAGASPSSSSEPGHPDASFRPRAAYRNYAPDGVSSDDSFVRQGFEDEEQAEEQALLASSAPSSSSRRKLASAPEPGALEARIKKLRARWNSQQRRLRAGFGALRSRSRLPERDRASLAASAVSTAAYGGDSLRLAPGAERQAQLLRSLRVPLYLLLLVYLCVPLLERPGWCFSDPGGCEDVPRMRGLPVLEPVFSLLLELACVLLFGMLALVKLRATAGGAGRYFRSSSWRALKVLLILASSADLLLTLLLLWVAPGSLSSYFRLSPFIRPLLYVALSRRIRSLLAGLLRSVLPYVAHALFLLALFLAGYACLLMLALHDWKIAGDEAAKAFASYQSSFMSVLVLLTRTNFPAMMTPAYDANRATFLLFFPFLVIGVVFLMSMVLATIFNHYKVTLRSELDDRAYARRSALKRAFDLLRRWDAPGGLLESGGRVGGFLGEASGLGGVHQGQSPHASEPAQRLPEGQFWEIPVTASPPHRPAGKGRGREADSGKDAEEEEEEDDPGLGEEEDGLEEEENEEREEEEEDDDGFVDHRSLCVLLRELQRFPGQSLFSLSEAGGSANELPAGAFSPGRAELGRPERKDLEAHFGAVHDRSVFSDDGDNEGEEEDEGSAEAQDRSRRLEESADELMALLCSERGSRAPFLTRNPPSHALSAAEARSQPRQSLAQQQEQQQQQQQEHNQKGRRQQPGVFGRSLNASVGMDLSSETSRAGAEGSPTWVREARVPRAAFVADLLWSLKELRRRRADPARGSLGRLWARLCCPCLRPRPPAGPASRPGLRGGFARGPGASGVSAYPGGSAAALATDSESDLDAQLLASSSSSVQAPRFRGRRAPAEPGLPALFADDCPAWGGAAPEGPSLLWRLCAWVSRALGGPSASWLRLALALANLALLVLLIERTSQPDPAFAAAEAPGARVEALLASWLRVEFLFSLVFAAEAVLRLAVAGLLRLSAPAASAALAHGGAGVVSRASAAARASPGRKNELFREAWAWLFLDLAIALGSLGAEALMLAHAHSAGFYAARPPPDLGLGAEALRAPGGAVLLAVPWTSLLRLVLLARTARAFVLLSRTARFQVIFATFKRLGAPTARLGGLLFALMYLYATIGVLLFGGLLTPPREGDLLEPAALAPGPGPAEEGEDHGPAAVAITTSPYVLSLTQTIYHQQDWYALNFNDFASALVTLFCCLLNGWGVLMNGVWAVYPSALVVGGYFVSFFVFAVLILLNLVTAIVIDAFGKEAVRERRQKQQRKQQRRRRRRASSSGSSASAASSIGRRRAGRQAQEILFSPIRPFPGAEGPRLVSPQERRPFLENSQVSVRSYDSVNEPGFDVSVLGFGSPPRAQSQQQQQQQQRLAFAQGLGSQRFRGDPEDEEELGRSSVVMFGGAESVADESDYRR